MSREILLRQAIGNFGVILWVVHAVFKFTIVELEYFPAYFGFLNYFVFFVLLLSVIGMEKSTKHKSKNFFAFYLPPLLVVITDVLRGSTPNLDSANLFLVLNLVIRSTSGPRRNNYIESGIRWCIYLGLILLMVKPSSALLDESRSIGNLQTLRFSGITNHPNLAATLGLAAFFLLGLNREHVFKRRIVIFLASIVTILLSGSRTGQFAFLFSIAMLFFVGSSGLQFSRKLLKLCTAISFIPLILYYVTNVRRSDWETITLNGRTQIWGYIVENWSNSPIIGFGTDIFETLMGVMVPVWSVHAHNQLLQELFTRGIVGLLAIVLVLLLLIKQSISVRKNHARILALLVALIIFMVTRPVFFFDRLDAMSLVYVALISQLARIKNA